jgi:hypothetical protein
MADLEAEAKRRRLRVGTLLRQKLLGLLAERGGEDR